MEAKDIYPYYLESNRITTDSRNIKPGDLFIALKGDRFNGNDFVLQSLEEGASYAICDEDRPEFDSIDNIFHVKDGLSLLQDLARIHRSKLKIPVIGLTGSNGKTTSKELLHAALSSHYSTYATKGNLNNHIGVPLSILEINPKHEIAVIEMGANHQKEISFLCSICDPEYGYITNIGLAHLEGFGGEDGVCKGKRELFDHLRAHDRLAFVNLDDPKVVRAAEGLEFVGYGSSSDSDLQGKFHQHEGYLSVEWWSKGSDQKQTIQTHLTGTYNFSNVLSAICIARYFGVSASQIKKGIEAYVPSNNRSQVEETLNGNHVIVDCYNANPSSMLAALDNLRSFSDTGTLAILGDMLELGASAEQHHREVLEKLKVLGMDAWLVGEHFGALENDYPQFRFYPKTADVQEHLRDVKIKGLAILLKGSRRMKLEDVLELL